MPDARPVADVLADARRLPQHFPAYVPELVAHVETLQGEVERWQRLWNTATTETFLANSENAALRTALRDAEMLASAYANCHGWTERATEVVERVNALLADTPTAALSERLDAMTAALSDREQLIQVADAAEHEADLRRMCPIDLDHDHALGWTPTGDLYWLHRCDGDDYRGPYEWRWSVGTIDVTSGTKHTLRKRLPVDVGGSVLCVSCGDHGFINNGEWVKVKA